MLHCGKHKGEPVIAANTDPLFGKQEGHEKKQHQSGQKKYEDPKRLHTQI
ncbi:MAG: hypothetical protein K8R52_00825 [Bacteroidales bacterium]|nr:hypothetical protein [Bacteroidales bacterium]